MIDFKGKKITVMGLGLHGGGVGTARFFAKSGAKVIVTDLKNSQDLKESVAALKGLPVKFVLGQHRAEDFSNVDMVIKNPAVPGNAKSLQIARENKIPIETDVGIFFDLCPAPIIGVTGTRGKSTTAALIHESLKLVNKNAVLAGNIRISVLDVLPKIKKDSIVVLELSSWQLEGLPAHKKSPRIAVVTNIMKDHLNRYKSMDEYIEAKKNIFRFQGKNDFLILNYDDPIVREFAKTAKAKIYYYGMNKMSELDSGYKIGAWQKQNNIVFGEQGEEILPISDIKLIGNHNLYNILAAITVGVISGVSVKFIRKAISGFMGLEGRLQLIRKIKGASYINDTASTTPDATIAAINSFSDKNIVLIAGGTDKNLDYKELVDVLVSSKQIKRLILLPGTATDKLVKELNTRNYLFNLVNVDSMQAAVKHGYDVAEQYDVVMLSPGAASFGLFQNEFDRGRQFNQNVLGLA